VTNPGIVGIRIVHGNTTFHVHGDRAGAEGVWLAAGQVDGLYEAPVKTTWKTGAFQEGSWQKFRKNLQRDITLGFHIRDTFTEYELNESLFRQIFSYELDPWETTPTLTTIEVETMLSGIRKLDVLMYEAPTFTPEIDPLMQQYGNHVFKLRAGQPYWYQDDYTSSLSGGTSGSVTVQNPTDCVAYQQWVLQIGNYTLPDFQWIGAPGARAPGGPNGARTVSGINVTSTNGGAVVSLDGMDLMFRDVNDTNILAQMAGTFFNYPIPPYTPPTALPVVGGPAQLVVPQRWSRPWGLELPGLLGTPIAPIINRLAGTGPYQFVIPDWASTIDVVLLGGGGGGGGGKLTSNGDGGLSGQWATATLVRGTDIPWATTTISGQVGFGGNGGTWFSPPPHHGTDGQASTASWNGTNLIAAGGVSGGNTSNSGQLVVPLTYNGFTYTGGGQVNLGGQPGQAPGGGGAGGSQNIGNGGPGARGQAWFRPYSAGS
jgi:hypothetical protein